MSELTYDDLRRRAADRQPDAEIVVPMRPQLLALARELAREDDLPSLTKLVVHLRAAADLILSASRGERPYVTWADLYPALAGAFLIVAGKNTREPDARVEGGGLAAFGLMPEQVERMRAFLELVNEYRYAEVAESNAMCDFHRFRTNDPHGKYRETYDVAAERTARAQAAVDAELNFFFGAKGADET